MFPNILCSVDASCIDDSDLSILLFIGGYIAHSLGKQLKCQYCTNYLAQDKELLVENASAGNYLNLIDRGGLKWPTDFLLNICTNTFIIFCNLIRDFEVEFCKCSNQRDLLINCSLKYHQPSFQNEYCVCERDLSSVVKRAIRVMSNILLNNYSKNRNNSYDSNNNIKRKLATVKS